jgi:AcrR family transcriptional regulator
MYQARMTEAAPPTLGRRERKKRAMRANILATATRLFSEHGYHETTVGQIADELDISSATFFNYFGSKDAIIKELADDAVAKLEARLDELANAKAETASLIDKFGPKSESTRSSRDLSRSLSIEIFRVILASPESQQVLARMERAITRVLVHSQDLGEARTDMDSEHIARVVAHMLLGAITAWLIDPSDTLEQRMDDTIVFMRRTIAANERAMGNAREYTRRR